MDISFTFTTGFMGHPSDADRFAVAYEVLPIPTDEASAVVLRPFRFWPVPTVTDLTKAKVGHLPGCDTAVVTFTFDSPVSAWVVRVNSRSHLDGTGVASGGAQAGATAATAEITDDDLLQGTNQVTVYGRGLDGTWTPPVGARA